jgi:hypothetical protein
MTGLQKFRQNLLFGEDTSDDERSILLVDIMNVIGFSKREREINRHDIHLKNELFNIFHPNDKLTITITGSTSEGMCAGRRNKMHHNLHCHLAVTVEGC